MTKLFMVTGTYHGSYIHAYSEGAARRLFHSFYNGESIIHISCNGKVLQSYELPYMRFPKFQEL